jgi:ribonuclease HI
MTLTIFTDGGSLNNPGEAAIAYAFYFEKSLIDKYAKRIGIASNNVAEYTALIEALKAASSLLLKNPVTSVSVYSDSQLMVNQLNGSYRVKDGDLYNLFMQVRRLEADLRKPIKYTHVLRGENMFVDSLVKKALGRTPTLGSEPA